MKDNLIQIIQDSLTKIELTFVKTKLSFKDSFSFEIEFRYKNAKMFAYFFFDKQNKTYHFANFDFINSTVVDSEMNENKTYLCIAVSLHILNMYHQLNNFLKNE